MRRHCGIPENLGMRWRTPMPKFDWSKEPPHWKLAAWALLLTPSILLAVAAVLRSIH
jgi:hypothetical protein